MVLSHPYTSYSIYRLERFIFSFLAFSLTVGSYVEPPPPKCIRIMEAEVQNGVKIHPTVIPKTEVSVCRTHAGMYMYNEIR